MPVFDRFDICAAHLQMEIDYGVGGILRERPSNRRRKEATGVQLKRLGFKPSPSWDILRSENAQEIYLELEERYGFAALCLCGQRVQASDRKKHDESYPHLVEIYRGQLEAAGWARMAQWHHMTLREEAVRRKSFPVYHLRTERRAGGRQQPRHELWTRKWMLDLIDDANKALEGDATVTRLVGDSAGAVEYELRKLIPIWVQSHVDLVTEPPPPPERLR